ncbi:hypothetical protein BUE80_DR009077, partial [Diplocarpon rosae]
NLTFSPRSTDTPNPYKPALQYLLSGGRPRFNHRQSSSSGSLDSDGDSCSRMASYHSKTSTEFRQTSIPLISISRSPSPYRRQHSDSNPASETDDDDWGDSYASSQPFILDRGKLTGWRWLVYGGGMGHFFFNTPLGWQMYIGLLVIWLGGCQIGLTVMNRIILWSGYLKENYTSHTKLMYIIAGVYKFPYPLATTLIEMLMTHCWILLSAYITRWAGPWLATAGLSGGIAPSRPLHSPSPPGPRGGKNHGFSAAVSRWASCRASGIAGGGIFEFDLQVVRTVLPCAIIFVAKRTYKALVAQLVPQGDLLGTFPSASASADYSGSREEARAYWRLLHYTSLLSILIFTPIVIMSGEVTNIWRNCYFLDLDWDRDVLGSVCVVLGGEAERWQELGEDALILFC